MGNITAYTYDNAGRLLTVTTPISDTLNSVTKYHYDANGNVIKTEQTAQAEGEETKWRTIEQVYDNMNRVTDIITHVSDTEKQYTHYEYNLAGDLTGVYTGMTVPFATADPDSYSHIAYTYDARGNNTSLTDALGQTESYTYDSLGMVVTATQRDGKVTKYAYNALGSIVSEEIYENLDAETPLSVKTTVYALTGEPLSVTIDGVKTEYTYNAQGNVLTETEGDVVKTYTYDSRGRMSSYTLTVDGEEKSSAIYSYDNMDRLTWVSEGGLTTTYTYDANGNRTSQTTGEVTTEYAYNKANLVTDMTNTMVNAEGDSVVISSFEYTYYADGNMHTKSETLLDTTTDTTYVYDGAGRLVSETAGDKVISYYYDANNNRTLMNNGGVITSYTYDKNNRLLTEGDIVYTYDANGNTLSAGNKTYNYNARGQQIGYSDGETSAQYAYNPSGLRSAKTVDGSTKYFIYNGMNIVYEYEKNILAGTAYYYGLNRTHNSDGEIYVYNAHGDTVQLVKDNAVVASYTYDAFGNLTSQVGESENPFLYCSEHFDSESQTYYLRARYYNPANGRFNAEDPHWNVSNRIYGDNLFKIYEYKDPLGLSKYTLLPDVSTIIQSGNLYVYCVNNPILYVDINGKFIISTAALLITGGALLFGTIGGFVGNHIAEEKGATGWEKAAYIAGGVVVGGTVGAAAGYVAAPAVVSVTGVAGVSVTSAGVSTVAAGAGSGVLYQTLEEGLNFSQRAFEHMQEAGRFVPVQTLIDAIKYGVPSPDPQGSKAVMYTIEMIRNGATYTLEVLYDAATNAVWHFMYY